MEFKKKETFIIGQRLMGEWLAIDPMNSQNLNKSFFYEDSEFVKELKICFEDDRFKLFMKTEGKNSNVFSSMESHLRYEDMVLLKFYMEYTFPVIMLSLIHI